MKRRTALKNRILCCFVCLLGLNILNAQNVPISENEDRVYNVYVEFLGAGINTLYTVNLECQILTNTISNLGLRAGFGFMKDRGWNSVSVPIMLNKKWGNDFSSHFLSTNIGATYHYGGPIIIDILNPTLNFDYNNNRFIYNMQIGYVYRPLGRSLTIELGLTSYMGSIVSHSVEEVSNTFIEENSFRIGFWPHFSIGYWF